MRDLLWRLGGADVQILSRSGKVSQRGFALIGLLYLLVSLITYLSFFGLFFGVFDLLFQSLASSAVLGFLFTNIYRLNLLSLDPNSLPHRTSKGSFIATAVIRYLTISALAVFVSKCFEVFIFNIFYHNEIIRDYENSTNFMQMLLDLNIRHPQIWIVTTSIVLLFVFPSFMKLRLIRNQEYYSLKKRREIRLVIEEHKVFKEEYNSIMRSWYQKYRFTKSYQESLMFGRYYDEPFNLEPKSEERELQSSDDFLSELLNKKG